MKTIKRNAVIITVMLFVCAAVYLNWSYNKKTQDAAAAGDGANVETLEQNAGKTPEGSGQDQEGQPSQGADETGSLEPAGDTVGAENLANETPEGDAGLYYSVTGGGETEGTTNAYSEYFAQVRLERQQARDEVSATLSAVAEASGASQETIDKALQSMTQIAQWTMQEAELENLIRAKGFIDCVVYLSDDGAKVTVAAEGGLTEPAVAKITDAVVTQTDFTPDQLTVIEIK